jgi:catechol-2,3-dioxygenase
MEILELELNTTDLPAQIAFYTGVLGLQQLHADAQTATWKVGRTVLTFRQVDESVPPYHFAFNVPVGTLPRHFERLKPSVAFLPNPDGAFINDFVNWKAAAFYFLDPAGNILECIDREELANYETGGPDPGPFVSVSEIGLVADDALDAAALLYELFGVPTFEKHRNLSTSNFNAVGDDRGLFILATEGRAWFPTDVPARQGRVRVVFRSENGEIGELERG